MSIIQISGTMIMVLMTAICPFHGRVEIEQSCMPHAIDYEPTNEMVKAIDNNGYLVRKCPKCSHMLAFKPIKAWHMINPTKKGDVIWESSHE